MLFVIIFDMEYQYNKHQVLHKQAIDIVFRVYFKKEAEGKITVLLTVRSGQPRPVVLD